MRDTTTTSATTAAAAGNFGAGSFIRADRLRLTGDPTLNEHWLRERIVDDPSVLGLGDLRLADEGHTRDGRLELLLRDPATGRRLTVLVRVGPAEDGDLVRAIENWTIERGRYPEHEHFAVIVAEELPPRFLSAAGTLGATIPLSAVQVSALRVGEHVALHFAVVIDRLPPRAPEHGNGHGANGSAKPQAAAETESPASARLATPDHSPTEPAEPKPATATHASTRSNGATTATRPASADSATAIATAPAPEAVSSRISQSDPWDDDARSADVKLPAWLSDLPDDTRGRAEAREVDPRGASRSLSLFAFVSLILCVVTVFGWVRSYGERDVRRFADAGREHFVYSDKGHLEWVAAATPADPRGGWSVKMPYWLPTGLTALLPFAWLVRRRSVHSLD